MLLLRVIGALADFLVESLLWTCFLLSLSADLRWLLCLRNLLEYEGLPVLPATRTGAAFRYVVRRSRRTVLSLCSDFDPEQMDCQFHLLAHTSVV
jgi:hypothetical protein